MAIYTIRQIDQLGASRLGRRVNCLTDSEALELAQRMANVGLSLQVWRGDKLLGDISAGQDVTTSEGVWGSVTRHDRTSALPPHVIETWN